MIQYIINQSMAILDNISSGPTHSHPRDTLSLPTRKPLVLNVVKWSQSDQIKKFRKRLFTFDLALRV